MFILCFFFFNDTATTEIYTLSLHDALPIWWTPTTPRCPTWSSGSSATSATPTSRSSSARRSTATTTAPSRGADRKSTRLNSSHANISYAVFCLKKKKKQNNTNQHDSHHIVI